MASTKIHIREMTACDISAVAALSAQLGYPISEVDAGERFLYLAASDDHLVAVACRDEQIVGWCHSFLVRLLESAGYAELGGIVVEEAARRAGVGSKLVHHAEAWTRANGIDRLRAYSGADRSDAHEFYRELGFDEHSPVLFQRRIVDGDDSTSGDI